MPQPEALILAGPNGAGKTTASAGILPAGTRFLNADLIAERLFADGHPRAGLDIAAGRLLLGHLGEVVRGGESFCVETNLADRGYAKRIAVWHQHGYTVRLVFSALESPELAVRRVATRVASGGHDVAEEVIRRRWAAGLRALFDIYMPIVDGWVLLNSNERSVVKVATGDPEAFEVLDPLRWERILRVALEAGAEAPRRLL